MKIQKKYTDNLENRQVNTGSTSLTVPDQALTVQDIMQRNQQGNQVYNNKYEAVYNGELEIPNVDKMDFVDLENYRMVLNEKHRQVEKEYNEFKNSINSEEKKSFDERLLNALESISNRENEIKNKTKIPE
nr:MAG: hypothetical protein [Microvirus sp.]